MKGGKKIMVKIGDKIKLISLARDPITGLPDPSWNSEYPASEEKEMH